MEENNDYVATFVDFLSKHPRNDKSRQRFKQLFRQRFEDRLSETVERIWDLPPLIARQKDEYSALLIEARELYLMGLYYSCVAMCGIVGERLVKDAFRATTLIHKEDVPQPPPSSAFDQFERVEVIGITRFLKETGLLSEKGAKAAKNLGELRNRYAHARGKAQQSEALDAIKLVHTLLKEISSLFQEYYLTNGVILKKRKFGGLNKQKP